ncbi:MAG: GatB/YqeY domain-containing protein [bacterium]|nr:GatB/YqeY domain-containing protein [bacterium]
MDLQNKIDSDLIQAQKEKNEQVRDTLRYLKSAFKNASIQKQAELTEQEIVSVIQKEIRQRKDAVLQYRSTRPELAAKEEQEISIIEVYLPAQLTDDQLKEIIDQAIKNTGATEMKDMGKIMSQVMPQVQGKADGSRVSKLTKELLSHE